MDLRKYSQYYREIGRLALPLFVGQLGTIALAFADNIMVGHYSTEALAAASFVNNFFNIAIFACMGFSFGLTPLIGALFARGENNRIGVMVRVGFVMNAIFTLVLMCVMGGIYFFLENFGQPEELMPLIKPYYLIVLLGMLPMMVFNVLSQWSYAIGNTAMPTVIIVVCNLLNILGNYLLIYGYGGFPELGLVGAGVSTVASRTLGSLAIALLFLFGAQGRPYREGFYRGKRSEGVGALVFKTGFPVSMQMFFETASFSGSAVFAGWLGAVPLAAYQIICTSGLFGFCIYASIASAIAIPMSHAQGKGDCVAMRCTAWAGYHIVLVCVLVICLFFIFVGRYVIGMFTPDPMVLSAALAALFPLILYQFGDASQVAFANALRGTSNVMPMLYIAVISYALVGLPLSYIMAFPMGLGLYGIILSFSVCLMLAGVLYLYFFLRTTRCRR